MILVTGRGSLDSSMGAFMISGVLLLLVDEESPTWCFGDHDESGYKHQILTLMESQILNWAAPPLKPHQCPGDYDECGYKHRMTESQIL